MYRVAAPKRRWSQRHVVVARGLASRAAALKSVEETYVKKTPIEHILMRPDLYVGPTAAATNTVWTPAKSGGRGKKAKVTMKENEAQ